MYLLNQSYGNIRRQGTKNLHTKKTAGIWSFTNVFFLLKTQLFQDAIAYLLS